MIESGYLIAAVALAAVLAVALLVVCVHGSRRMNTLLLRHEELARQRADDGRELNNLRRQNERLTEDVRDRRHLMYWAARELNEHTDPKRRNAVIDKLVELTYYENLAEELPVGFVYINELCRSLVEEYGAKAAQGVSVDYRSSATDFYAVHTNRECLEKVMRNLLENAVAHTTNGHILIEVTDDADRLEVAVTDTGTGIGQERRHAVFSLLKSVSHMKRRISTGLNISRTLVERLGGSLYIDPHYTQGTCVRFSIEV